jgi:hypothetical protein
MSGITKCLCHPRQWLAGIHPNEAHSSPGLKAMGFPGWIDKQETAAKQKYEEVTPTQHLQIGQPG